MLSPSCKSYAACPTFHFSHVPGSCMEPRCVDGSGKLPADAKSCRSQQSQLLSCPPNSSAYPTPSWACCQHPRLVSTHSR